VCTFAFLKVLDMSNNAVVSLPDGILDLDKLEELNLAGNKLKDLPKVRCGNAEQGPGWGRGGGGQIRAGCGEARSRLNQLAEMRACVRSLSYTDRRAAKPSRTCLR
jgi:Leucine-rich repeat (LRR) protein